MRVTRLSTSMTLPVRVSNLTSRLLKHAARLLNRASTLLNREFYGVVMNHIRQDPDQYCKGRDANGQEELNARQ
jgi:hypothetical protein